MRQERISALEEIHYVKLVTIGGIHPGRPFLDEVRKQQADLLNRCLNDYPKGRIIGKDISVGRYQAGEHELTMEKVTYHIGFTRKPEWEEEEGRI